MDTLELEAPIATLRSLGALSPESMNVSLPDSHRHDKTAPTFALCDPIYRGIVTGQEAVRAMQIYFENCHPWAPVLDEELALQGAELRRTHPLLFLALVCIGAQFWTDESSPGPLLQPRLHPRYFELAALFDRAVSPLFLRPVPSDANIDTVCVLLLCSQWMPYLREDADASCRTGGSHDRASNDHHLRATSRSGIRSRYNDLSAWVMFGLAIRYASFMGLERTVTALFKTHNATTSDAASATTRADLARARVWLNLVTYDCNLTLTSGLPTSLDAARAEATARLVCEHRMAQVPGDLRYFALVELACILQRARSSEKGGGAGGSPFTRHPNIDVLKRANMEFEDWERRWLPKLRYTHAQHNQLPFTSVRWYRLALNSSALRRMLSLSGNTANEHGRQPDQQAVPVWVLGALETSLTAAAQILFSLSAGAASAVWLLASQNAASFPAGPFSIDRDSLRSMYHAVDSVWVSHAFALIFLVLCYVRGRIDDDLQICSLVPAASQGRRAPAKLRPTSILARLAQLALDIFGCCGSSEVSAFRPIDKISTLVLNATSLVLSPSSDSNGSSPVAATVAERGGFTASEPALQELLDLMGDSGLDWPATLSLFGEDPLIASAGGWAF